MAETTEIVWCDSTFNPWMGCTKVGPGCDHCYAETLMDKRYGKVHWGAGQPRVRTAPANWRKPLAWQAKAKEFLRSHGRRQRVFCASLADVFDTDVPPSWRLDLFSLIAATPDLDWLLLTKRIGNVARMCSGDSLMFDLMSERVWLGATVVTQAEIDRDLRKLNDAPALIRFLSMEPLLEPAVPTWEDLWGAGGRNGIDWVIVGGESGPGARPMSPAWARAVRDACAEAGVAFLFKQWGDWAPYDRGRGGPAIDKPMQNFGKKLAGRLLDGIEHNGFPVTPDPNPAFEVAVVRNERPEDVLP